MSTHFNVYTMITVFKALTEKLFVHWIIDNIVCIIMYNNIIFIQLQMLYSMKYKYLDKKCSKIKSYTFRIYIKYNFIISIQIKKLWYLSICVLLKLFCKINIKYDNVFFFFLLVLWEQTNIIWHNINYKVSSEKLFF